MGCCTSSQVSVLPKPDVSPDKRDAIIQGPYLQFLRQETKADSSKAWHISIMVVHTKGATTIDLQSEAGAVPMQLLDTANEVHFYRATLVVDLKAAPSEINYSVNTRKYSFHVPSVFDCDTKILYFSCNGFDGTTAAYGDGVGGIRNPWMNVLSKHKVSPFHVGVGGGDQLYCDPVFSAPVFTDWIGLDEENDFKVMYTQPFTKDMEEYAFNYYLNNYLTHFSKDGYSECLASIPMINTWDDHDIFDGYGSYLPALQNSPVMQGVYQIARKFYLLFQHQMLEKEISDRFYLKDTPGSISSLKTMKNISILSLDLRANRSETSVTPASRVDLLMQQLESLSGCHHLLLNVGVPVLFYHMPGLLSALKGLDSVDDILESQEKVEKGASRVTKLRHKISNTLRAAHANTKKTLMTELGLANKWGNVSLVDDLVDHWGSHVKERDYLLNKLVEFSAKKGIRVTILSGDVHFATMGELLMPGKESITEDNSGIYQLVSSPMGNMPNPTGKMMHTLCQHFDTNIKMEASDGEMKAKICEWKIEEDSKKKFGENGYKDKRNFLELRSSAVDTDRSLTAVLHVEESSSSHLSFSSYKKVVPPVIQT